MDPVVAGLVLAWLTIGVLSLALAGTIRQLRTLQGQVYSAATHPGRERTALLTAIPDSLRPNEGQVQSLILVVTPGCAICERVIPVFDRLADIDDRGGRYLVLASSAVDYATGGVELIIDPDAFASVYPGWSPALVCLPRTGGLSSAEPVGSEAALEAVFAAALPVK